MDSFFSRLLSRFSTRSAKGELTEAKAIRAFHDAVHMGDVEQVRTLLAARPALATSMDEHRFQPIHLMDMYFEADILNLLLQHGADINARNDEGVTLLHIITEPEAVPLLVHKGADLEARDVHGVTPLLMQVGEQQNGSDVVAALLECGADVHAMGGRGETALSIAREAEDQELIALLRRHGARA